MKIVKVQDSFDGSIGALTIQAGDRSRISQQIQEITDIIKDSVARNRFESVERIQNGRRINLTKGDAIVIRRMINESRIRVGFEVPGTSERNGIVKELFDKIESTDGARSGFRNVVGTSVDEGTRQADEGAEARDITRGEFTTDVETGGGDELAAELRIFEDGTYTLEEFDADTRERGLMDILAIGLEREGEFLIPLTVLDDDYRVTERRIDKFAEGLKETLLD